MALIFYFSSTGVSTLTYGVDLKLSTPHDYTLEILSYTGLASGIKKISQLNWLHWLDEHACFGLLTLTFSAFRMVACVV